MEINSNSNQTTPGYEISIDDVIEETGRSSTLLKPENFGAAVESLDVDDIHKNALKSLLKGRHEFHLLRLLKTGRSLTEHDFALDYIENINSITDELEKRGSFDEKSAIIGLVNGDSADTTMWWTLAPYLQKSLKESGLTVKDSLMKVFEWANTGNGYRDNPTQIHLRGIEHLNKKIGADTFILSENPNGISHQYASQIANKISISLI